MAALAPTSWLTPVLRRLPAPWIAALDAWSYRIAQKRAEQRRQAGRAQAAARSRQILQR